MPATKNTQATHTRRVVPFAPQEIKLDRDLFTLNSSSDTGFAVRHSRATSAAKIILSGGCAAERELPGVSSTSATSPTHSPNSANTRLSRFLGSGRITGNPHLTRRWPFGRVTEGLPTILRWAHPVAFNKNLSPDGLTSPVTMSFN